MRFKRMSTFTIFAAATLLACNASAIELISGRVTYIEATYLPGLAQFAMDAGSPSCPAGQNLLWQKSDPSNNQAVYAALMFAMATGKRVSVYVNDGDTSCTGQYFQILSN